MTAEKVRRVECECGQAIEVPDEMLQVTCPNCGQERATSDSRRLPAPVPKAEEDRILGERAVKRTMAEADAICWMAGAVVGAGKVCFFFCGGTALLALLGQTPLLSEAAAGFLMLGLGAMIVAQLMFIRAELVRKR